MDEQIRQIAERLRGLRDVLELTADDIARDCDISAEEYRLAETGEFDISVSMLQKIALRLLPPLCLGMDEAKEFLERFKKVL